MRYFRALIPIAVTILICIGVFAVTSRRTYTADVVLQNDIIQTVREEMDDLSVLSERFPNTAIYVYDVSGIQLWPKDTALSLRDARKGGYLLLAVNDGSRAIGTAVIPDPAQAMYEAAYRRLVIGALALLGLMVLGTAIAYLYLNKHIIEPFKRLREFTGRIAMGDLDTPLAMERDSAFGIFTESFDIMREELKAAKSREIELKMRERELVASLSHDLRTPLAGIRIICDVLSVKLKGDDEKDRYVLDKVNTITQKTDQMDALVTELLTSALDDLGEMNVRCTDESSAILHDIVTAADPKGLTDEQRIPECMIHMDKMRMQQIIGNIIGNSYKYAETVIDIEYSLGSDHLKMTLTDHGPGVDPEELSLITNRFYRGKGSDGKDGSGLGLYIASELMEKMKGELICSSRGKGLTVTLMIPLA